MGRLEGKVAWVTGAGSGIGEAAALALAGEGAALVLTGRRPGPLEAVAARIAAAGGRARVEPGDVALSADVARIAAAAEGWLGRLDVLVNNAGSNIPERSWARLGPEGVEALVGANLMSAFYGVLAALPIMRRQGGGLIVNVASVAGRVVSAQPGPGYTAAKHGVVALTHSINAEEGRHNIRATAICPGEVATPILERRPVPVGDADKARMLQPEDVGELIRFVACLPARMCVSDVMVTPTWNRAFIAAQDAGL